MNAGNKKFEEKLKIVTLAYTQLKLAYKGKKQMTPNLDIKPDIKISVNQSFGINTDMLVDGFSKKK